MDPIRYDIFWCDEDGCWVCTVFFGNGRDTEVTMGDSPEDALEKALERWRKP